MVVGGMIPGSVLVLLRSVLCLTARTTTIKASSGHEPTLFLCSRQQEANRTPEFCQAYSEDHQILCYKKKAPQHLGAFPQPNLD
jgi:hypothetical protein